MNEKNLVIVESPGKVRTIQQYLGKDFLVKASIGHIRDLEEHKLSVDVSNGFQPEYVIPSDKKKVVAELKKLSAEAATVWLASDEDREGEAISWHLQETLGLPREKTRRIVFHEITKQAILEAIEHPRDIDMNLVNAQQARRVLDRLVGFELSPILWRKIQPKLSAGRVQSVALRLIVDREKEIMAFRPEPYYRVEAGFRPEGSPVKVKALLDTRFATEEDARRFLEDSIGARYSIVSLEKKEGVRVPAAPFTTSTLQQEAARKLRFPVSTTMRVAQALYERGLITYMRTDSTNLSSLALGTAKQFILNNFGPQYRCIRAKFNRALRSHLSNIGGAYSCSHFSKIRNRIRFSQLGDRTGKREIGRSANQFNIGQIAVQIDRKRFFRSGIKNSVTVSRRVETLAGRARQVVVPGRVRQSQRIFTSRCRLRICRIDDLQRAKTAAVMVVIICRALN